MERKTCSRGWLLSRKVEEGCYYLMGSGRIVDFDETELLWLNPKKSREDRIILAQEEHFCTAAQALMPLIPEEKLHT